MKTLDEHNVERHDIHEQIARQTEKSAGVACKCGEELILPAPHIILTSNPPQKNVRCPACGFTGYMIA